MRRIIIITIIAVVFFLFFPFTMGSFGIRPATHGCIGLLISHQEVNSRLPEKRADYYLFRRHFSYYVDYDRAESGSFYYCLGKDVWYGE